jgi:CBS domain-containing protein
MLTDRDMTIRAVAEGLSPVETEVQQVMTSEVEYIFDDYPVEEAARYMSELQVRRLPV